MEFILNSQAKAEVEMAAIRQQQAKATGEMAGIRQQQAKAAGEMAAIRKLIRAGMKMIVRQGEHLDELAKAQKVTEVKLQSFIESLRRGRNGNHRRN
jgi:hypothetical protein